MTRSNWQYIKDHYPSKLQPCIQYFKMRFLDEWRISIKQHRYLFDYFRQIHGFEIEVSNNSYSLEYQGVTYHKDSLPSLDAAEVAVIMLAFYRLNTYG